MATTRKYLNHLLQNTGITPACSEEEREAAEDIAQIFVNHFICICVFRLKNEAAADFYGSYSYFFIWQRFFSEVAEDEFYKRRLSVCVQTLY